ncbi:MAG: 2-oxo acid dehydrogenase subunit E2 [Thaumarchaeota archaeon]|nr:2-oxo acid dehydrogenase subunit E2 [Nitrososphaerota archaeon]
MEEHNLGEQVVPFPKNRQWTAAAFRSVQNKPMIHGLIEVDVSKAREFMHNYKAKTGESLSFTAFLIACLAKAVDDHKAVQAIRMGGNHLVIYDEVDVWTTVEHDIAGQKVVMPHIVRAANRKSFHAIHEEIRAAQVADVERVANGPRFLPAALFGLSLWLLWRMGRARPRLVKKNVGTVGITAIGMFGKGGGWGIPIPTPMPLMITVGGIGEKRIIFDDRVESREYLSLTISIDHNIVDGAPAARFTQRLRELIESCYGLDSAGFESERTIAETTLPNQDLPGSSKESTSLKAFPRLS